MAGVQAADTDFDQSRTAIESRWYEMTLRNRIEHWQQRATRIAPPEKTGILPARGGLWYSNTHCECDLQSFDGETTYSDAEIIEQLKQKLQYAELKIRVLEGRLRLQRIAKYGPGSEKLPDAQLELLELEPGVSSAEVEAESQREALPSTPKTKRKHQGGSRCLSHLPRIERVIACAPEQCVCGGCGADTSVIGYEESEQLDVEPAKYFVLVTKREKRACKRCEERGVMAAPLPLRIIEKSLVSDRIVIDTVINKYASHLPLYRQSVILKRDTGLELSRATLDGWVMRVGELLTPIVGVMRHELLAGTYIQADETPVDVQTRDGRGKNHQAYLWQYGTPGGAVVFDFRMGRGREGPKHFLKSFEGILQTDGYVVYDHVAGARVVHAACWAHARRGFFEAVQLNREDVAATQIVARMDELFSIDARAREEKSGSCCTACAASAIRASVVGKDPAGHRTMPDVAVALQCAGQGLPLHADAMAQAHALSGIP